MSLCVMVKVLQIYDIAETMMEMSAVDFLDCGLMILIAHHQQNYAKHSTAIGFLLK